MFNKETIFSLDNHSRLCKDCVSLENYGGIGTYLHMHTPGMCLREFLNTETVFCFEVN